MDAGPKAQGPFGNPKVREAPEASLDRQALNQVVFDGEFVPSNQPQAPGTAFHSAERPVPPRDVARARRLLAEAGVPRPSFTLLVVNTPVNQQVAQVIQAMAAEAGFDVRVQTLETGAPTAQTDRGDYEAAIAIRVYLDERPHLFLYHNRLFWAMSGRVSGFQPHQDGPIRLQGVRLAAR